MKVPNSSAPGHTVIRIDDGLLSGGTKPLPEPILACQQLDPVAFKCTQFNK